MIAIAASGRVLAAAHWQEYCARVPAETKSTPSAYGSVAGCCDWSMRLVRVWADLHENWLEKFVGEKKPRCWAVN